SFVIGSLVLLSASASSLAAEKTVLKADGGGLVGGASTVPGGVGSAGNLASLAKAGQGVKFAQLPAAKAVAIHYASVEVGTISLTVNDQPPRKLNVHSSGDATKSLIYVKVDVA